MRVLYNLTGELRLIDKQQTQRLQTDAGGAGVRTNSLAKPISHPL